MLLTQLFDELHFLVKTWCFLILQDAELCSHYMQHGTCKFGTNCNFHHPDPKSEHANLNASRHVIEESTELNFLSEPIKRAQNERSVSLVTSPTSGTIETIPTRGDSTCTEHSAYKVSNLGLFISILSRFFLKIIHIF
jgi:hypothetical protein